MELKIAHADPANGASVALDVLDADGNVTRTIILRPHQFEIVEASGLAIREVSMAVVQERERQAKVDAAATKKQAEEDAKAKEAADTKAVREEAARTKPKVEPINKASDPAPSPAV